jgi:hypothetical protein
MTTARTSLSAWEIGTVVGLAASAVGIYWIMVAEIGFLLPPFIFGSIALVLALLVAARVPWITVVAALVSALFLFAALRAPMEVYRLTHPELLGAFVPSVLQALGSLVAVIGGLVATVQRVQRHTPTVTTPARDA